MRIGGRSQGVGIVRKQIPFTCLGMAIHVDFLVLSEAIPTIRSTKYIVDNNLDISITHLRISYGCTHHPLKFEDYFLIHRWKPGDLPFAMYTTFELCHIHRSFGHPSVRTTTELLRRAKGADLDPSVVRSLKEIGKDCGTCKLTSAKPQNFNLTIGSKSLRINHHVQDDTTFLDGRQAVHMVYEATHFFSHKLRLKSEHSHDL